MPVAAVITLEASQSGEYKNSTGRGVHGFWYNHWGDVRPKVANHLHTMNQVAPFTLSPIMGIKESRGKSYFEAGKEAWFRLVALTSMLSEEMQEHFLPNLPDVLEVEETQWKITGYTTDPEVHHWAGEADYSQMASEYLYNMKPPSRWRIAFETPTTVKGKRKRDSKRDIFLPFPLPNSLVRSWLDRWQAFSPISLPEDLPDEVLYGVVVSNYSLRTKPVKEAERTRIGCLGRMTLHALNQPPVVRAAVDLLVAYAFYAGSGYKTTQGMGLTLKL